MACFFPSSLRAQVENSLEIPRVEMVYREIKDFPVDGLRNFVITVSGIIEAQSLPGNVLRVEAVGQGTTFLHIWDSQGRRTFEIEVKGFELGPAINKYRPGFQPGGSQFSYRMTMTNQRIPGFGFLAPLYEHEFNALVPLRRESEWRTTIRAITDARVLNGPDYAPFSGATEPTYMLSYYRTPHLLIGAGDVNYDLGDLSISGFPVRGGLFQYRRGRHDQIQAFGGWLRPFFGNNQFADILPERLYGISGTKEVAPNLLIKPSFAFLNQSSAPPIGGQTFQNDFIGNLAVEAKPLNERITLEGEYGRSKNDNAYRALVEYRPYWGRLLATYRRIGTNYLTLSQGFLLKDFQEATFTADAQPYRTLGFTFNYLFDQFGLGSNTTPFGSKNHNFILTTRWNPDENTDYIGSVTVLKGSGPSSHNDSEVGTFTYERSFEKKRSRLYAQANGFHRNQGIGVGNSTDETGGGLDTRYQRYLSTNLQLFLQQDLQISRVAQANSVFGNQNFTRTNFTWGPSLSYAKSPVTVAVGFNESLFYSGPQSDHFIQPFMTASYSPSQALTLGTRNNLTYDLSNQTTFMTLLGEFTYRFGPGIPDTLVSTFFRAGSLTGRIFIDKNGDGVYSPGETLLDGFQVSMDGGNPLFAKNGEYKFKADPGPHQLLLTVPATYQNYKLTSANPIQINVGTRQELKTDFGLTRGTLLLGSLVVDLNQNGKAEEAEGGAPSSKIRVTGPDFDQTVGVPNSGIYRVFVPQPGTYQVKVLGAELPVGYKTKGSDAVSVNVGEGEFTKAPPLLLEAKRFVTGRAFLDVNKNGAYDPDDPPAAGIQIHLGKYVTKTESDGTFLIPNVEAGRYEVEVSPTQIRGYKVRLPAPVVFGGEARSVEVNLPFQK
ncbi:MAG: hypothetical protein U1F57_11370 [bacterium]